MPFTTVKTEGGILPADLLSRIAAGEAKGLQPIDYHLAPTERLNEAISRSWNRLLGVWRNFDDRRIVLDEADRGTTLTRENWLLILFQELGYGRLSFVGRLNIEDSTGDKQTYPISHLWEHIPIHLVSFRQELDRRDPAVGRSPHSLLQEALNRSSEALWGFTSNGLRLRLLRDNASLTRAAYVEFDLEAMMAGELYSDFSLLWLVCHQSRVERGVGKGEQEEAEPAVTPVPRAPLPSDCWLERWSQSAAEQGARALDALRDGVQEAINALGKGFLEHKANQQLRADLQAGRLSTYNYYRQLLRLAYRLIFLFVAEDRDLLLRPDATPAARQRYRAYSIGRLRDLAAARRGGPHPDLYRSLRLLTQKLREGYEPLGLPGLGGFLFSDRSTPHPDAADLANRDLLDAIRALAFAVDNSVRRPVDYRNLDTEELGSVYESLLELHPQLNVEAATFTLEVVAGSERKTTGSHYTPTPLVNSLLDTALEPVVVDRLKAAEERWRQGDDRSQDALRRMKEAALLAIKVLDYAVGSGHMLIGAGRRLARHLAHIRTGDEEPSPDAIRAAMRDVVGHCLYGVDINEMAVELCKVALWMETLEPGKPLTFLDKNIQCGNSLIGATPALLEQGIPDETFIPIEGDNKAYCQEWKRRNKVQRTGQLSLYRHDLQPWDRLGTLATAMAQMEATDDDTLAGVHQQEQMYQELVRSSGYRYGQLLADAWCAAFVWKKTNDFAYPITEEVFRRIERDPFDVAPWMVEEIERLRAQYQFFHWHLAFPQIFTIPACGQTADNAQAGWNGGADVVLSNPPWERIKLQEKEWFASRRPDIATAPNAAARRKIIDALVEEDPALYAAFLDDRRAAEGESAIVRNSGRYPLCGRGDVNTYAVFAELARHVISPVGRAGIIVPSGIATDDTTKFYFQDIMETGALSSLYDFENRRKLFPAVDSRMKFCLLTLTGTERPANQGAQFVFFALDVADLRDPERRFTLSATEIALLNPNTRTCPTFRGQRDAMLTKMIYRRVPVLILEKLDEDGRVVKRQSPWESEITRTFDMARFGEQARRRSQLVTMGLSLDAGLFVGSTAWVPILESKTFWQFDHRASTYQDVAEGEANKGNCRSLRPEERVDPTKVVVARYWLPWDVVTNYTDWHDKDYWLAYRNITNTTNERTTVATVLPRRASDYTVRLIYRGLVEGANAACLLALLNSFVFDYCARQSLAGTNFSDYVMKQMPVLSPQAFNAPCIIELREAGSLWSTWFLPRVLELTYTAWDLQSFARDCGYDGPPFRWDEDRRFLLRCELDAAYFHLYGIARDDVDYIMDTFPIVKRKNVAAHGEYRTKRVILEIYDAMQRAIDTGEPYQTLLDPPPADPRVAHTGEPPAWLHDTLLAVAEPARSPAPPTSSNTIAPAPSKSTASRTKPPKQHKPASAAPSNPSSHPGATTSHPTPSVPAAPAAIPIMPPPTGTHTDKIMRLLSLKQLATPEAIGEIVAALGDDDANVRWLAGSTLMSLQDARVVAAMRAFMAQTDLEIARQAAQEWLGRIEE